MAEERQSDEQLMLQYQAGDAKAFAILYHRYKTMLYRYLIKQCGAVDQAEELFQDIWFKIIKARKRYVQSATFRTYVFHIAHNRLIDYYRRNATAELLSYEENKFETESINLKEPGPEALVDGEKLAQKIVELVDDLPAAQKEVFLLKHEAGLELDEIASSINVKIETAKSRLRYAMGKLRQGIGKYL